ncbi:MAG: sigma 54-interacting transcriptional regulator [Planctomycetota bacterium]
MAGRWSEFLQRLRGDGRDAERQRWLAILDLNRQLLAAQEDVGDAEAASAPSPRIAQAQRASVLTVLVDEAVRLFGAERGFLVARTEQAPGVRVEVARSLDQEPVQRPERKVSMTILQRVLEEGDGIYSDDAQLDDLSAAQSVADMKLRSVLCMPLRAGARVLGVLYLDHRFQSGAFGEADLPWLSAFADQAAIVLHLHDLLAENRAQAQQLAEQNESLRATVAAQAEALADDSPTPGREQLRHAMPAVVGHSPALLRVLHVLDRVAQTELSVLLTGESGTGKEVAARAVHDASARRSGPFVGVNCAAIQGELLQSELFGHEKGAFTGADRDRQGLLRHASGGTLFLDEVTEMDLELQAKLLRVLEERRVRPVGSDRDESVDVRVVSACNRDPRAAIADGRLREDLYFRLAVATVHLPPLRARGGDVVELAVAFLAQIAAREQVAVPELPADFATALRARSWPGNVRQLRNELERAWALADGGVLRPESLSPEEADGLGAGESLSSSPEAPLELAQLEQWAIDRALERAAGNKAEAARLLGIGRRTLYDKLAARDRSK